MLVINVIYFVKRLLWHGTPFIKGLVGVTFYLWVHAALFNYVCSDVRWDSVLDKVISWSFAISPVPSCWISRALEPVVQL